MKPICVVSLNVHGAERLTYIIYIVFFFEYKTSDANVILRDNTSYRHKY